MPETALSLEKARVRDLLRYYTPKPIVDQKLPSLLDHVCETVELEPIPPLVVAVETNTHITDAIIGGSGDGELDQDSLDGITPIITPEDTEYDPEAGSLEGCTQIETASSGKEEASKLDQHSLAERTADVTTPNESDPEACNVEADAQPADSQLRNDPTGTNLEIPSRTCSPDLFPTSVVDEAGDKIPDNSVLLAHDPTLMAFTQLGAFRTNCQRSFISLMDDKKQYLIAEATRSVSLDDPNVYDFEDEGERVYLGARVLDQQWGVCPNTIQVFTAQDESLDLATDLITANKTCYIMNDLSAIPVYANRPYVAGWPFMRFYAEVPIHSPTGYVIGTYCVVDNKPRDGLNKKEFAALNEIASAIMNHLALVRTQMQLRRAGEMVKGLGDFVEGKAEEAAASIPRNVRPKPMRPANPRMGTAETLPSISSIAAQSPSIDQISSSAELLDSLTIQTNNEHRPEPSQSPFDPISQRSRDRRLSLEDFNTGDSTAALGTKLLFSRASSLIRNAIDLDGIMFVDTCLNDSAPDPIPGVSRTKSSEYFASGGTPETKNADCGEWLYDSSRVFPDMGQTTFPSRSGSLGAGLDHRSSFSDLLGHSSSRELVLYGSSPTHAQVALPPATLRGLLRHYKHGKIFEFEGDGILLQNPREIFHDEKRAPVSAEFRMQEREWAQQLRSICTGATSIIFFPLWDPQRDQWFSGSIAWTNVPTRLFGSQEMAYLTAFGSCIMAEKSRLDALNADRAKADFISSVSHELRSPLHGVLASAEALQDISSGYQQDDLIRTIKICGEVLLDTMDQILDYAKTSKEIKPQTSNSICLDLGTLVESVVDGILAGHNYRKGINNEPGKLTVSNGDVMVILSIDCQESWLFQSQIGGWKRILMNLFGNALKYTDFGYVHVILQAKAGTVSDPRTTVKLEVVDSGRGMSKDYMKYQLYTPFAQEDEISIGTGLGLSIVRALVNDLGGTIEIASEKGFGTSAKVTVALEPSFENPEMHYMEASSMIADIGTRCKGLTICLVGFEYYPDMKEPPTGILTSRSSRMLAIQSSIKALATDWFGMRVSIASSQDDAHGDILIQLRSTLGSPRSSSQGRPLIVFDDITTPRKDEVGIFYLSQPAGPHKLARLLEKCLQYISDPRDVQDQEAPLPTLPIQPHEGPLLDLAPDDSQIKPADSRPEQTGLNLRYADPTNKQNSSTDVLNHKISSSVPEQVNYIETHARKTKVLLVEDNPINMKILMNYMKKAKQEYTTAANGLEAIQLFQATPNNFRVIFMDISMPVKDGLTATREIRQHELQNNLPRTRIVALTCFSSPEYQRDAALSGIDMFLIKPIPMKTLSPILAMDPNDVTVT